MVLPPHYPSRIYPVEEEKPSASPSLTGRAQPPALASRKGHAHEQSAGRVHPLVESSAS
jgi:hypothetical protein